MPRLASLDPDSTPWGSNQSPNRATRSPRLGPDGVEGLVPGRQDFPGGRVKRGARSGCGTAGPASAAYSALAAGPPHAGPHHQNKHSITANGERHLIGNYRLPQVSLSRLLACLLSLAQP